VSSRIAVLFALLSPCALVAQNYTITTLAGGGLPVNIPGTSANLAALSGVSMAADKAGNLYFPYQNTILRMDAKSGMLTLVAGTGTAGFTGDSVPATSAQLNLPNSVAIDSHGNIYIADTGNNRVREISDGTITTVAGDGTSNVGVFPPNKLGLVIAVAVDPTDNLYICDRANNVVWEMVGSNLMVVAGNGHNGYGGDNNSAPTAQLNQPNGIAFDPSGNLYIADSNNERVRMVSGGVITTVAGTGKSGYNGDNQAATAAMLNEPIAVATDPNGNLYIADESNGRVRVVANGIIQTFAGIGSAQFGGDNGPATKAGMLPGTVTADALGNVYIGDSNVNRIRKVNNGTITTVVGGAPASGGPASGMQFGKTGPVAVSSNGDVYVADSGSYYIWKVSGGIVSMAAGNGTAGKAGNGGPATSAQVDSLAALALDSHGNLYIGDAGDVSVREVSNGVISLLVGPPALSSPSGIAADSQGKIYVADVRANRIFQLNGGVLTPVAGSGTFGYNGDNISALSANLNVPNGIAVDASGNLFIADTQNCRIREVSNATITTVAGKATCGYSGDDALATDAELYVPKGVAVDAAGNIYIADTGNNVVRKVSNGVITTIAGADRS